MKGVPIKRFIPGIAWFFVVLVLTCTPGKDLPKSDWLESLNFDKLVHIVVFGLLAVLFSYPFRKSALDQHTKIRYYLIIALSTSAWGYCIELIQHFFIPGRTYDLLDWAADSIGAVLAFIFCRSRLK